MKRYTTRLLDVARRTLAQYVVVEVNGQEVCRTDTFEKAQRIVEAFEALEALETLKRLKEAEARQRDLERISAAG
ncbi:hypothetical protein HNR42_002886 [Deinobacterium chartae]|uniref:Uncharacterized protein n=1 Tax=Deinobacterium chartae TaxID=521158 RepID=A0A841I6H5_9DEIO|nr:hypothetical protein [Deinobacterium chartae]MBB6099445.1 hypothetical protein [Deinobacterium chartae]